MWSIGVLLYVMLSKTMPFRAKEVDQLLKQVHPHTPSHTHAHPRTQTLAPATLHLTPSLQSSPGGQGQVRLQARGPLAQRL